MHCVRRAPRLCRLVPGVIALVAPLVLADLEARAAGQPPKRPPNVVFILADDLGWGDLHCYGNRQTRTPNLDRLAEQGTLFTQFYVNGSVCSPSRCAFMTGHFPARHAIHGHFATAQQNRARGMPNWLDPSVPTVPRLLKSAGYATAHFGKWHLGGGPGAPKPEAYGIDASRTINSAGSAFQGANDPYFRARSTDLIVDEAIRFIEANRDRPFYINVWTLLTHATLNPTPEQLEPFARLAPEGAAYPGTKAIYYSSLFALDQGIGRLLKRLDQLGLSEDTLVVFSSDNGPEDLDIRNAVHSGVGSAGPFRGRKRSLYEGGVREPLVVRWPGHVPAGKVDAESLLSAVDLLPTVCKLAGLALPEKLAPDGEDASDVLLGQSRARVHPLLWEWRFRIAGHVLHKSPMLAIRDGRWKLLLNPNRERIELYDIPSDPSELDNQSARHPEIVERLAQQVLAWQQTLPPGPRDAEAGSNAYPWPKPAR